MTYEIYHAGVPGMKWGVRKDRQSGSGGTSARKRRAPDTIANTTVKTTKSGKTTITAKKGDQKAKLTVKRDRGAKLVAKNNKTKLKVIISNTASVASGALWVASAFVPGLPVLNTVAAATNLVGVATSRSKGG